jgi:O-antigen ligase
MNNDSALNELAQKNTNHVVNPLRNQWLAQFLVVLGLIGGLLNPGNPDYLFPLIPEALLISGLCLALFSLSERASTQSSVWLTNAEASLLGSFACVMLLYLLPRMMWSLSHTPHQVWNPCENIAPSVFVRMECYLQGAIVQFPGPRQFYMIIAAFLIGLIGFLFSRVFPEGQKLVLKTIAGFSILYCAAVFTGIALGKETLLPEFIGRSEFGGSRLSLIIPNPSWVWPYLAPGAAALLWLFLTATSKLKSTLYFLGACFLTLSIYKTGQRGGLLLVGCLWAITILVKLVQRDFKKIRNRIAIAALGFIVSVATIAYGKFVFERLMAGLGRTDFVDANRMAIWKTALPHLIANRPWFGFGYGSWFQEYRAVAEPAGAPLFDTAHNLYVQLVFEHGIAGALLIISLLAGVVWICWKNNRTNHSNRGALIILAAGSFLCCTMVQEIDYIRPTFYMHAMLWGAILGGRSHRGDILNSQISSTHKFREFFLHKEQLYASNFVQSLKRAVLGLFLLCTACILFVANYFSLGAQPFEGDLRKKEEKIGRWLGPVSKIPAFGKNGSYWRFRFDAPENSTTSYKSTENIICTNAAKTGAPKYLLAAANSKLLPSQIDVESSQKIPNSNRYISIRLYYPPERIEPNSLPRENICGEK